MSLTHFATYNSDYNKYVNVLFYYNRTGYTGCGGIGRVKHVHNWRHRQTTPGLQHSSPSNAQAVERALILNRWFLNTFSFIKISEFFT